MKRPSPDVPPMSDLEVPALPLSVLFRYRHRRHLKGLALGYGIAVGLIFLAFITRTGVVFCFGFGFAVATGDLGQRVCRKQGCRAFARKRR